MVNANAVGLPAENPDRLETLAAEPEKRSVRLRPLITEDYLALGGAGRLHGIRTELIFGEINERTAQGPRLRPLSVDDYMALARAGRLDGIRTELIHGEIIEMSPQGTRHALVMVRLSRLFWQGLSSEYHVRCHLPIQPSGLSMLPEPDFAIVRGVEERYLESHPSSAELVVEISDTTLQHDRRVKSPIYAAMGISEYWIVDLENNRIEVQRDPVADPDDPSTGWRYGTSFLVDATASELLAPLCLPDFKLDVGALLI